ncbi:hypothetical protein, partial [Escherichia coli]|uniref:hypothetical protein n=1 Tax=Escherichia coli TaxID=562 RepID=UPI001A8E50F2
MPPSRWLRKQAQIFCKESVTLKDVEQKTTFSIIFFASITLKTTGYIHDDDDDKITKMRIFPRRPAPWTA